jgi:hypothetical protein
MTSKFVSHLSDIALSNLRHCVGIPIQGIFCPGVEIRAGETTAKMESISIPVGPKNYLVITNNWADSTIEAIDYYLMNTTLADRPRNISVSEPSSMGIQGWIHHSPFSHFRFGPQSRIKQIDVFCIYMPGNLEHVEYDSALHFTLESDFEFCVSPEQSISGQLELNFEKSIISQILSPMKLREKFTMGHP